VKTTQTVWVCDACGAKRTEDDNRMPDGWRVVGAYTSNPVHLCGGLLCKRTTQKIVLESRAEEVRERDVLLDCSNFLELNMRDMHVNLGKALTEMEKAGVSDGECSYDRYDSGSVEMTFKLTCRDGDYSEIVGRVQATLDGEEGD